MKPVKDPAMVFPMKKLKMLIHTNTSLRRPMKAPVRNVLTISNNAYPTLHRYPSTATAKKNRKHAPIATQMEYLS
ncbi:Protein of unknown function [Gryllus bimaculatus]|nr:Protein of unknown function [Gryllus bimaculatus]